jgi:hypothetical protein
MSHTYLICSMDSDLYDYELGLREDYSQEESSEDFNDFNDMKDGFDMDEEPDWFYPDNEYETGDYYNPSSEI